jgi:SurA-like N-terminal domain
MAVEKQVDLSVAEVVDFLRVTGRFQPAVREVVERRLVADAAKKKGLKVSTQELQRAADAFRLANGLKKASATESWLKSMGITVEALEDFLETNLLIGKLMDSLENQEASQKYLSSPLVKDAVRGLIYQDWLGKLLK